MSNGLEIIKKSEISSARRGVLKTAHGDIQTPFFMPIATKGAVKTLSSADMEKLGAEILLSNTYHLYLKPGVDVMRAYGGLHKFMDWYGPILTDSGGYQVFSLSERRKITEEGVEFASHIDGSKHLLTPEKSMDIQQVLGSDIVMAFDECTPPDYDEKALNNSVDRTVRWAERSKKHFEQNIGSSNNSGAMLFGINQGATDEALRIKHAEDLKQIGFDGYAIGGLSVGEPFEEACKIVAALHPVLPADKPRYFMGGAKPHEIVEYVKRGVDMMDCVLPSRNARHGLLYRFVHDDLNRPDFYETIHITNSKYANDQTKLSSDDGELSRYTFGYLHHLFDVQEMLGYRLATLVNIKFYLQLMEKIRAAIESGAL
ncbi:MAG: tRNA guanosine(34) transglycosylase Tgt [Patescibacteria group bacterium]|nr:tRNA guanosine(34) transglycosylase Tgt [Patescibacteria group bacterium]